MSTLSRFLLEETASRADLPSRALYQRARIVVPERPNDPYQALREDGGIRSILESSGYSPNVTYAAIVNPEGVAVAAFPTPEGETMEEQHDFEPIVKASAWSRLQAVYSDRTTRCASPRSTRQQAVRHHPDWRLDGPGADRAAGGHDRGGWVVFVALQPLGRRAPALAVDAPADSRDSEQPEPARSRGARRAARPARTGVQGSRQLLPDDQRAAGRRTWPVRRRRSHLFVPAVAPTMPRSWRTSRTESPSSLPGAT